MKRRRPIKVEHTIWCDVHGEIHPAENDYYEVGDKDCTRKNWRPVYVLGEQGEEF